jgi:hypothetical protein
MIFTNGWIEKQILFTSTPSLTMHELFVIFIIRKARQSKEKWLLYRLTESIAHESCHIAHIGFSTKNYEELL